MDRSLKSARIFLVDDEAANLKLLRKMLEAHGYINLVPVQDSREILDRYSQDRPDLILLDLRMPYLDGFEVMARLKALEDPLMPPVVVLTAQKERESLLRAFECGVRDYLTKPFEMGELLARVHNMLEVHLAHRFVYEQKETLDAMVRLRTEELLKTRLEIVQRLGRASEYRDNETGRHIIRVSQISVLLAKRQGCDDQFCETLMHAAPMHDVGKIGIPDAILLKPGKLEPEEWEVMKRHTIIGANILAGGGSDLLRLAQEIAYSHHERWDGGGYPKGLVGEDIPLAARIVALADVFDALTSERPYKKSWSVDAALEMIRESRGSQFDPQIVDLLIGIFPEIVAIRERLPDCE
jgi:putative two-component system response regulator